MNTFSNAVNGNKLDSNFTRTTNGMKSYSGTGSSVLDLFTIIGTSRKLDISKQFADAMLEDENLAVRVLLWARDIRGGAGERNTFRKLLSILESKNPALAGKIMHLIPVIGRADDLFTYQNPENRKAAFEMYEDALYSGNALFAKWCPREKSAKSALAGEFRKHLGLTPKAYRKLLVNASNTVETQMCAKDWDKINFSHVPSLASARYSKAFTKRCGDKYKAYLAELAKPSAERNPSVKVNAGAVYPYDVVKTLQTGNVALADAQFDALPDFVGDNKILPMIDTSGSMTWVEVAKGIQPYHVAVSLGLYLSSRTSSDFKDMVLEFSNYAKIHVLSGSLSKKMETINRMTVHMGTNLHSAFDVILTTAIAGKVPQENMPTHLLILSDMQFDSCVEHDDSAIQMIRRKYNNAGYEIPKVVFWNLNVGGSSGGSPVSVNNNGVAMISGFSPAIMASVLGANPDEFTPYAMMMKTIMAERYNF